MISAQNERIAEVLTHVTGEKFEASPKNWWNWWGEFLDEHPDVAATGAVQEFNTALLNRQLRGMARGTWVATDRGQLPIETILPGDKVLSQSPLTGELAFRVVQAVARYPGRPVERISLDEGLLHCTPGQVLWKTGEAWTRVATLSPNVLLHGVDDERRVKSTTAAFTIDCYDLVVDEFHTYFVGSELLLTHDATPLEPCYTALPGFSPAAVSAAARSAVESMR